MRLMTVMPVNTPAPGKPKLPTLADISGETLPYALYSYRGSMLLPPGSRMTGEARRQVMERYDTRPGTTQDQHVFGLEEDEAGAVETYRLLASRSREHSLPRESLEPQAGDVIGRGVYIICNSPVYFAGEHTPVSDHDGDLGGGLVPDSRYVCYRPSPSGGYAMYLYDGLVLEAVVRLLMPMSAATRTAIRQAMVGEGRGDDDLPVNAAIVMAYVAATPLESAIAAPPRRRTAGSVSRPGSSRDVHPPAGEPAKAAPAVEPPPPPTPERNAGARPDAPPDSKGRPLLDLLAQRGAAERPQAPPGPGAVPQPPPSAEPGAGAGADNPPQPQPEAAPPEEKLDPERLVEEVALHFGRLTRSEATARLQELLEVAMVIHTLVPTVRPFLERLIGHPPARREDRALAVRYLTRHGLAVSVLASTLAAQMKATDDEVRSVASAALHQDVSFLRDETLRRMLGKTRRLSQTELDALSRHPEASAGALRDTPLCVGDAYEVVLHSHERPNGSGYPQGLRGSSIHELARVLMVADTYVALVSPRPYRPALRHEQAMEVMDGQGRGNLLHRGEVKALGRILA